MKLFYRSTYALLQVELDELFEGFVHGFISLPTYLKEYDAALTRSGVSKAQFMEFIDDGWVPVTEPARKVYN